MFSYVIKRILAAIPIGIGVVTVVSLMIHTIPGDPVDIILGEFATGEERQALRSQLGLDLPLLDQWLSYLSNIARGDLSDSLIYNRPVLELIGERILPTLELACLSILLALFLSIPIGIVSALNKGKKIDFIAMTASLVGVAMPNFWLGPMLILLFSLKLEFFPVSERIDFSSYVLPSITLGSALAAILSRMTRNSMLDTLNEDFIRTARAKGHTELSVIGKHALRNASLPLVSLIGLQFGVLLTGAVITEKIFDWPGLGSLILEGLGQRDYPLVQGCVLVFSFSYLIVNLVTDISYVVIDPRIKLDRRKQ